MDKEQLPSSSSRPVRSKNPPIYLKDYVTSLPSITPPCITSHLRPPSIPLPEPPEMDSTRGNKAEIDNLKVQIDEIKDLIFHLGKTVQSLVGKDDSKSRSSPPLSGATARLEPELPIVKELQSSLSAHHVPYSAHAAIPCSLQSPPGSHQSVCDLRQQGTQTSGLSIDCGGNDSDSSDDYSEGYTGNQPPGDLSYRPEPPMSYPVLPPIDSNPRVPSRVLSSALHAHPPPHPQTLMGAASGFPQQTMQQSFLQSQVPLNPYGLSMSGQSSLHPTAHSVDYTQSYTATRMVNRDATQPLLSNPPSLQAQSFMRPPRTYHIAPPSFPSFTRDDPQQFVMLKMAFSNLVPVEESEQFKYHLLLDHLKFDSACSLALAYAHHPQPYTRAMAALQQRYGQPQQLVLREISSILNFPSIRSSDSRSFNDFAIRVRALVGMLQSLENHEGDPELACASHVQQLLGKLPTEYVANYARYSRASRPGLPYNLLDFANWLEEEAECQAIAMQSRDLQRPLREAKSHVMYR
ncbi:unnamed protein product [Knipowitschia caucasica]